MDELALLRGYGEGDPKASREFYNRFRHGIYNQLRPSFSQQDAQEMTHEVLVRAYKGAGNFKGKSAVTTWLYRITANVATSAIRQKQSQRRNIANYESHEMARHQRVSEASDQAVICRELLEIVDESIEGNPEWKNEIVRMRVEGRSYDQIQDVVNRPRGTIKTTLHRERHKIQKKMKSAGINTTPYFG